MDWLIIVAVAAVVLIALGWWLSYTAARLHRMHTRVEGALAALDAYLIRRAESTMALAVSGALDPASSLLLADAASDSLEATTTGAGVADLLEGQRFGDRAEDESHLTEALRLALPDEVVREIHDTGGPDAEAVQRLHDASVRLQMARSFHAETVAEATRLRRQPFVRVFRLAGHAAWPLVIEFDDALPEGLENWPTLGPVTP